TTSQTHTGSFAPSQSGQFTITVSNVGTSATSGTVAVSDSVPAGLTATSISGSGWTCSVSPAACSRADALAAGQSFPAITLNVSVAANPPFSFTNVATVSGGGDASTGNNTSNNSVSSTGASTTGTAAFVKTDTTTKG